MRFDANRLARLAGLGGTGSTVLSEASNKSYHDDPALAKEREMQYGKNQLNEKAKDRRDAGGGGRHREGDPLPSASGPGQEDSQEEGYHMSEMDHEMGEMHHSHMMDEMGAHDDQVLEIDENMLRREVMRMRKQRLQENQLRRAIRSEISDIFKSYKQDSSWIYGDKHPRRSRKGGITTGFPGIGFKAYDQS